MIEAPTALYSWPWLDLAPDKIIALVQSLINTGFRYESGPGVGKIAPLRLQASEVSKVLRTIDCSGFVRWALFHALGKPDDFDFPDGSVNQYEWVKAHGFKASAFVDAFNEDGGVRVACLTPQDAEDAGMNASERHIMLVVNGKTCESHGGRGPDRRAWGGSSWMRYCELFVLTPPASMR